MITSPPIQYTGSKWRIAPWIMGKFPKHESYIEPYCGGASVLFRKRRSSIEVINDLDGAVINFFDVLRNRTDELLRAIQLTPYARAEVIRAHTMTGNPLEDARRFYIRAKMQFGGVKKDHPNSWRYGKPNDKRSPMREWLNTAPLMNAAKRLQGVYIECDTALATIDRFDSTDSLFFIDPPYVAETRTDTDYIHEMTDSDHIALSDVLHKIKGMALISGYDSALYRTLYKDWACVTKKARTVNNVERIEHLWVSPNAQEKQSQRRLF